MRGNVLGLLLSLLAAPLAAASESAVGVLIAGDAPHFEDAFAAGQLVPVQFTVATPDDVGVFGVEFALTTSSPDVAIKSVTFNPAFGQALGIAAPAPGDDGTGAGATGDGTGAAVGDGAGSPETARPRKAFSAVRVQPAATLDRTLGANGQAAPLATVTFEILTDRPFEAEIEIRARGSLTGEAPARTTVLDPATTAYDGATGRNVFKIISHGSPASTNEPGDAEDGPGPGGDQDASAAGTPPLAVTLLDAETGVPASTLSAGRAYDLYYDAGEQDVNGYVLFAVSERPGQGLALALAPLDGPWSASGNFMFRGAAKGMGVAPPAAGYPQGFGRCAQVVDNLFPPHPDAGPTGHLLTIVPESAGTLRLQLTMMHMDMAAGTVKEMETRVELPVQ